MKNKEGQPVVSKILNFVQSDKSGNVFLELESGIPLAKSGRQKSEIKPSKSPKDHQRKIFFCGEVFSWYKQEEK